MILEKNFLNKNPTTLINLVFGFFPISFILGNFITNINVVILCCLGIYLLRSNFLKIKFNFTLKVIFLFFFVILFSTSLSFIKSLYFNEFEDIHLTRLIKSIVFFRFFLMLIIVYFLSEFEILNFKYFFISSAFFAIFISADVIYQYIFGHNIIGLKSFVHHNTSFFGDEMISGGYIQNFSFFSIFFITSVFKNKLKINFLLGTIAICILGVALLVAGNRMSFILFLFGGVLASIIRFKSQKALPVSFLILLVIIGSLASFDDRIRVSYKSFYGNAQYISNNLFKVFKSEKSIAEIKEEEVKLNKKAQYHNNGHIKIFLTAIDTWSEHKLIGNGMKSFRIDCTKVVEINKFRGCSNHPHNYYLEILTDLGVIGFIFAIIIALLFIVFLRKNYRFVKSNNIENLFLLAATISLMLEVFPIKSTGSIFSTNNTTYIILVASVILSHKKLLEGKNFR